MTSGFKAGVILTRRRKFLFIGMLFLAVLASAKPGINGDGLQRFYALQKMLGDQPAQAVFDEKYDASLPVLAVPLYGLAKATAGPRHGPELVRHLKGLVAQFNHLLLCGFLLWFFTFLKRRFGFADDGAAVGTLVFLLTSFALPHTRDFYSEMLWSGAAFIGFDLLVTAVRTEPSRRLLLGLGLASFFAVWGSTVFALVWVPLVALATLASVRKRRGSVGSRLAAWVRRPANLAAAAGVILAVAAYFIENQIERGSILANGYEAETWRFAPITFWYIFASPGKGLLWFIPALWCVPILFRNPRLKAAATPEVRTLAAISAAVTLLLTAIYGSWWAWGGAVYWGPRFFLYTSFAGSTLLVFLLAHRSLLTRWERGLVYLCAALSAFIVLSGMSIGQHYYDGCRGVAGNCHLTFIESPYYVFGRPKAEWLALVLSRYVVVLVLAAPLFWVILRRGERRHGNEVVVS